MRCECHKLDDAYPEPCGHEITGRYIVVRIVPEQLWGSARASKAFTRMGGIEPIPVSLQCWNGWAREFVADHPRDMIDVAWFIVVGASELD